MQQDSRLMYILKTIWPPMYRFVNAILYFIITIVKNIVSGSIKQIKDR